MYEKESRKEMEKFSTKKKNKTNKFKKKFLSSFYF